MATAKTAIVLSTAGILIYINELAPNSDDIRRLKSAMDGDRTDLAPDRGDPDYYALRTWTPGTEARFSDGFLFRRAIRVIPVDETSIAQLRNRLLTWC